MGRTDYLPSNILEYSNLVHNIRTQVTANMNRWDISSTAANVLDPLIATLDATVKISENPATRTAAAIAKRNEARDALDVELRPFIQGRLIHNNRVTDDDLRAMGLPVHDRNPSPVPDPVQTPPIQARAASPGVVELDFGAKGKGIHGAEVCWVLSETPILDWSDLLHSAFATHTPLRLSFEGRDRGKWLYFAARWENTRGVKGPWTEIQSFIVP
jgi:hypothetical protein